MESGIRSSPTMSQFSIELEPLKAKSQPPLSPSKIQSIKKSLDKAERTYTHSQTWQGYLPNLMRGFLMRTSYEGSTTIESVKETDYSLL